MEKKKSTRFWPAAIIGLVIVASLAYVARTLPDSNAKNNVTYIMEHSCTKAALDLGMDKTFTAYPDSARFKYTCENGQVFWSNK